ncbi:Charged multivesicular body protein 2a [Fasciolopsis buskii]|uniref:Charged multivesicular body protein 2a n=1 Tax=Fasciolopsis buskii TaxID=27845 RepID=A0A8E0RK21_9TREM|nr:Charged multivesicular body protein 2a [Fasciolopsis buski]
MMSLFGSKKTVDQQLRANKRAISRAVRELDTEKRRLEQDKTRITGEIKKLAKQNEMDAVRILAKQIVRNNNYIKRFTLMRTNLEAVGLKLQTLKSTNAMAETMKDVTRVMRRMNASMKLPQLQKIMMEFEKQSGLLESKEEMMSDAIDDALGDDDIDESETIVNKVLEELGIEMSNEMAGAPQPSGPLGAGAGAARNRALAADGGPGLPSVDGSGVGSNADTIDEDDLEARLARLKRG